MEGTQRCQEGSLLQMIHSSHITSNQHTHRHSFDLVMLLYDNKSQSLHISLFFYENVLSVPVHREGFPRIIDDARKSVLQQNLGIGFLNTSPILVEHGYIQALISYNK